jgi:fructose-1,6-bisphosphatase I
MLQPTTGRFKTLEQFILEQQDRTPLASGTFSRLIRDLGIASKVVNSYIRRAGLLDVLGESGEVNVQDEVQQKLDAIAHAEFVEALRLGGEACLVVSEEADEIVSFEPNRRHGEYIVLLDPLDGSSNIDVNVSVGTIFSVYRLPEGATPSTDAALQPGTEQVAAGYVIYGSSTMFVFTSGQGVNGFTLDPSIGEFLLSHPNIKTPATGRIYSINEGNYRSWEDGTKQYIKWVQVEDKSTGRPLTSRYIGSFVADFHRNLLKGGIYIYPANVRDPRGKLRLMYEANPMAFIVEQAGGLASTGKQRILDVKPTKLHQRTPVYIGSADMVKMVEDFVAGRRTIDD